MESEIAKNVKGVKKAQVINLRAMDLVGTRSSVLIQFDGVWSVGQITFQTLVFEISMSSEPFEILGHRDYVSSEWQAADVGG